MAVYLFKAKSKAFENSQLPRGAVRPQKSKHRSKPSRMKTSLAKEFRYGLTASRGNSINSRIDEIKAVDCIC